MLIDSHIHMNLSKVDAALFEANLKLAGVTYAGVFCQNPIPFYERPSASQIEEFNRKRLDGVMELAANNKAVFPFYFIEPTEDDSMDQVDMAVEKGISGFKCICDHFYPGDDQVMQVFEKIAKTGKPIMFHSGILYDGSNISGKYNKPDNFEELIGINNLKFSLAHVGWPWTDECIALYGKFHSYKTYGGIKKEAPEMFIDLTPGTPDTYRKAVFENLLCNGFDIENNLIWGTDSQAGNYDSRRVQHIYEKDLSYLQTIGEEMNLKKLFANNYLRFIEKNE